MAVERLRVAVDDADELPGVLVRVEFEAVAVACVVAPEGHADRAGGHLLCPDSGLDPVVRPLRRRRHGVREQWVGRELQRRLRPLGRAAGHDCSLLERVTWSDGPLAGVGQVGFAVQRHLVRAGVDAGDAVGPGVTSRVTVVPSGSALSPASLSWPGVCHCTRSGW